MTLGAKFDKEVSGSCSPSYQVLTVIPKVDCGASCAKKVKVKASSNEWGYSFTVPTTPTAATAFDTKIELSFAESKYMWGYNNGTSVVV